MSISTQASRTPPEKIPPLQNGDHLTADEFLRRYEAMPDVTKAELIQGVVHMPSPVNAEDHGEPHFDLIAWLGIYRIGTPGIRGGDNSTVKLDIGNVPQPDAHLRIEKEYGGQSSIDQDGYLVGGPELIAEVAASSVSYDLHDKLQTYQEHNVQEYVVWRVWDGAVDWFLLHDQTYVRNEPQDGILQSRVFSGLWLDPDALVRDDMNRVMEVLRQGMATPEYADFVEGLQAKRK